MHYDVATKRMGRTDPRGNDGRGDLVNGEPFDRLEMPESGWARGARGVAFDSVCEANGRVAAILHSPEGRGGVSALTFGGAELNTLYVTADSGKAYRRPAKVHGISGLTPLPRPRL